VKSLSYRLLRLHDAYLRELGRLLDYGAAYGRKSPAEVMQKTVAASAQDAFFDELEKHVDQEPDIYRPRPREGA
jgi:hypothetical protein